MTPELYDFRNPARRAGERERRLEQWLAASAKAAVVPWTKLLSFPAKLEIGRRDEVLPEEWFACLPETTLGLRVRLGDEGLVSLLVLPRTLAVALLDGLMGEAITGMPADVPLSPIEESLLGHLTETLLLAPPQALGAANRQAGIQPPHDTSFPVFRPDLGLCTPGDGAVR
jgi:hypothetical protein